MVEGCFSVVVLVLVGGRLFERKLKELKSIQVGLKHRRSPKETSLKSGKGLGSKACSKFTGPPARPGGNRCRLGLQKRQTKYPQNGPR